MQIRPGEALQMAELFSGVCMGWSRAGYVLRACGLRCHTSWCLDSDGACIPRASVLEPGLHLATTSADIPFTTVSRSCVFLRADLDASWWRSAFIKRPVHVVCMSSPCQPWSSAGLRSGLKSADGVGVCSSNTCAVLCASGTA